MIALTNRLGALLVSLTSIVCVAPAHARVYVVAIGSQHYAAAPPDAHAFGYLGGANRSAQAVASRFIQGGAAEAIVLTSALDHFVTPTDIDHVVDEMGARIRTQGDAHPFLFVYYAGHGISEGVGWNNFLVPGSFTYKGDSSHLDIEGLAASTTLSAALVERLTKIAIPYMLVLDTCSEGKEADFQSSVLTGTAVDNLTSVAGILRFMNEFHQADPVLFSTPPGTRVQVSEDPTDPQEKVGPLGRRIILLVEPALKTGQPIALAEFVERLRAADLDASTRPAVTLATPNSTWSRTIFQAAGTIGATHAELGSGTTAIVCCAHPAPAADERPRPLSGRVEITGTPGEFVTDGKTLKLTPPGFALSLIETKGALRIMADKDDDTWEVDVSAPQDGKLTKTPYRHARRFGFDEDRPGLAITSPGRACSDLTGEFDVKAVSYDAAGHLEHLEATVTQRCVDADGHATATLSIDTVHD